MKFSSKIPRISPRHLYRWVLYGWASLIVLLALYAVVGERGAIHLWRLQGEKARLDEQNYRLQKANESLREKITRLRNDNLVLEQVAREELNLVRPGEIIYRFPPSKSDEKPSRVLKAPASESRRSAGQKAPR